jgi:serine/threonine protein kinase
MEYCEEGDLGHHIKRQARKGEFFSQEIVESWVLQVLLALEYLHNLKIVHRYDEGNLGISNPVTCF